MGETGQLRAWLVTRGHELVGRAQRPLAVRLRKNRSTHTAWLRFSDAEVCLEIKKRSHAALGVGAADSSIICQRVVAIDPALRDIMPRFLGTSPSKRHIAMEFVPGDNLERLVVAALRRPGNDSSTLSQLLAASGRALAAFHGIRSDEVGLKPAERSIASFLEGMRGTVSTIRARGLLADAAERMVGFASEIAQPMLESTGSCLLPIDAQPKNVLVPNRSRVCLVDLDFTAGPRGLGVAFFLVSLDRIALRAVWPGGGDTVDEWKRSFVRSYLEVSGPEVAREILFFYPWMLTQVISDHLRRRPLLSWALATRYRRPLHDFMSKAAEFGASQTGGASRVTDRDSWLSALDSRAMRER